MENEDQEFWRALLANRRFRSRFIRDLEMQAISSRSAEDLALRHRDEEMLPGGAVPHQSSAASASW
jgi:hypothetical protein